MATRRLTLWFDYASPYAYLATARIARLRDERLPGAEIDWQPFLLGPIFQRRQGGAGAYQDVSADERSYRWRDIERLSRLYDLPWQRPDRYPPHSLLAARLTLVALEQGWGEAVIAGIYQAAFGRNQDIADPDVLGAVITGLGQDAAASMALAVSDPIKQRLRVQVEAAITAGIFGAPSLVINGEIFWGNDRLEQALDWALQPWLT